jgi:exoribonuclease II
MLLTEIPYEDLAEFNREHGSDYQAPFFVHQTQAQLQKIVDQTLDSLRHKREIVGDEAVCKAARVLLKKAASADKDAKIWVRWGMHQPQRGASRGMQDVPLGDDDEELRKTLTQLHHFTVTTLVTGENDWHLYTDKAMHTVMYMSRGRTEIVKIENV